MTAIPSARPVALSANQATLSTSTLSAGTHTVEAVYSGSTNFQGSTGTLAGDQTVNPRATTTSVSSSLNPSTFGESVTFTATVAGMAPAPAIPAPRGRCNSRSTAIPSARP